MKYNNNIIPIMTYNNMDINKSIIILNNKRKCGISRLNNIITGKSYIGSSVNLASRFTNYYSRVFLENRVKKGSSIIYNSLLKYGYYNFSVDILEYCELHSLIAREQYYMDILKPEYNILKVAGSVLGFKDSEATKAKMIINNLGKKHTLETRQKIGLSIKLSVKVNIRPKLITMDTKLKLSSRSIGVSLKVLDLENNIIKIFPTLTSAAKYFKVSHKTLNKTPNMGIYDDKFIFKYELKDLRV
jgi:group I intron endonuclease